MHWVGVEVLPAPVCSSSCLCYDVGAGLLVAEEAPLFFFELLLEFGLNHVQLCVKIVHQL